MRGYMIKKIAIIGFLGLLAIGQALLGMDRPHFYYSNAHKRLNQPTQEPIQEDKAAKETTTAEILDDVKDIVTKTAAICGTEYAKVYGAAYGLIFAHELGHWAASRLLLKEKGIIWVPFIHFLPCEGFYRPDVSIGKIIKHFYQNPKDIFNMTHIIANWPANHESWTYRRTHYAAMFAAGPLSGCLASYLLLKGNTFYNEYEKNNHDFKKAFQKTQEKPLFNSNQNFWLQLITAIVGIHANLFSSFYPWGNTPTQDGDRMFDALKIKNPRPLLRKTIGMSLGTLTACALGKSIFDAWKDKF